MGIYLGGLIIGRIFASEIWGAYCREGLFFAGAYYPNFTVFSKSVKQIETKLQNYNSTN